MEPWQLENIEKKSARIYSIDRFQRLLKAILQSRGKLSEVDASELVSQFTMFGFK